MFNWVMALITGALLLTGGTIHRDVAPCRVVTEITVQWDENGIPEIRRYSNPEDMDRVLHYLRHLKPVPTWDAPEETSSSIYEIQLFLSDGSTVGYTQMGLTHLQKDGETWQTFSADRGIRLRLILAAVPGESI